MDQYRMTDIAPARRTSRFWLYAPFVLLAILAIAWSAFWFHVRGRVAEAVDAALLREADQGRSWTCTDRQISGFPFRVELRCSSLALASARWGDTVKVQTGPSVVLGQIYSPNLVIAHVTGPLQATLPEGRMLDLNWSLLEASLRHDTTRPEQLSIVMNQPQAVLKAPGFADETWRATEVQLHMRRNPSRPEAEQAVDLALSAKGSQLPAIDALLGTTEPGDVDLQATLTQSLAFRAGFNPDALEAWRNAAGVLDLTRLVSTKGQARIEASGQLMLDPTHRPAGRLQLAMAGIQQIAGIPVGGLTSGLGGLLGGRLSAQMPGAAPGLTPLPPLVLRDGRVFMGPIRLPLQPLPQLY
jgi:hypothetical protein